MPRSFKSENRELKRNWEIQRFTGGRWESVTDSPYEFKSEAESDFNHLKELVVFKKDPLRVIETVQSMILSVGGDVG